MTLILKRSTLAKDFVTGGQDSIGVRVPNHPIALSLLQEFHRLGGKGVAAPSANRFGHVSPTSSEAVHSELNEYLEDSDLVLNGGQSFIGLESTIIDCNHDFPRILRPGAITLKMIQESSGMSILNDLTNVNTRVSGCFKSHYAPRAKVLLNVLPMKGQGYIAAAEYLTPDGVVRLASPKSHEEFARNLYTSLRKGDELNLNEIVIQQPSGDGLALAIRDRTNKAAAL
jgi:L-threonylcarbamoyladenylate synthase